MKIGFDAKRAYHNGTGLGHYSRTLVQALAQYYPQHQYYLFNPTASHLFTVNGHNITEVQPAQWLHRLLPGAWRSSWVKADIKKLGLDIYHGLSHEIPAGLHRTATRSVVTMHDLIFERYPEQYAAIDVKIYRRKFTYACTHANHIIAISQQTKSDLVKLYKVPAEKISVCYQSCNPAFGDTLLPAQIEAVKQLYNLPAQYYLYVGSIIERKNLLTICKAMHLLQDKLPYPLVVIGEGSSYLQQVQQYVKEKGLQNRVLFLSYTEAARNSAAFKTAANFPAIYQGALAMIYPSVYEGFGIPVLEALWSRLPVITSNTSCMPETGGDAALYVSPLDAEAIADAMWQVTTDEALRHDMIATGWAHAQNFTNRACAAAVMDVYNKVMQQ